MMDCPKCASETLVETNALGNIPLDVCPGCKGIWFDKGELEDLLKQSQGGAAAGLDLISPKPSDLSCPRCKQTMSRGGLINPLLLVDKCGSCGGVWLDARELDLVKKLLGLTGGPATEVNVERQAPAPEAPKATPAWHMPAKIVAGLAAVAGLAGFSAELYMYFSPSGSVGFSPSAPLMAGSAVLLAAGIFTINGLD